MTRTAPRSPPSPRSASRAAIGMRALRSQAGDARSAGRPSRSAPTSSVSSLARPRAEPSRSASGAPATSAMRCARQLADGPRRARERHGEDRAHARAHRLRRVRVRAAGPERDAGGAERVRGAQHRADVAGVADAVQVHAQRTRRARPSAARRRRSRACPSRARRPRRSARGLDVVRSRAPPRPRAGEAVALERRGARRAAAAATRSSPSAGEACRCASRSRLVCRRRSGLQARVLCGGDGCHRVGVVGDVVSWANKKGAVLVRSGAREAVSCRLPVPGSGSRRLAGDARQNVGRCRRRARRCRRASCGRARRRPAARPCMNCE